MSNFYWDSILFVAIVLFWIDLSSLKSELFQRIKILKPLFHLKYRYMLEESWFYMLLKINRIVENLFFIYCILTFFNVLKANLFILIAVVFLGIISILLAILIQYIRERKNIND